MKRYDVYHTYGYTRVGLVLSTSSRADAIAQCDRLNRERGYAYNGYNVWDNRTEECVRNGNDALMDGGF